MNLLKRLWRWLIEPRRDTVQEQLKYLNEKVEQSGEELRSTSAELERKAHEKALEPKDLSDLAEVPAPHPGQVQHVDLTKPLPEGAEAPAHLERLAPSDFDLLAPEEQHLFTQLGHDPAKTIRYPAPTEQSTQNWVTEQLTKAGYSEAAHRRFVAFRRVAVGMSMRHLNDLKRRADNRDTSLTTHDLIALRSRGIS